MSEDRQAAFRDDSDGHDRFQRLEEMDYDRVNEFLRDRVTFMAQQYTRQAVFPAQRSFEDKIREAGATFLYGATSGFFTPDELDDILYESTEVATSLIEIEGGDVPHDREAEVEERLAAAMQEVHRASVDLRRDRCPHCGEDLGEQAE